MVSWQAARSPLGPAECGQLAVDLGQAERLWFFRVVLGPVLDRGVAAPRHADGVVLAGVARDRLLQRDLVFPVGSEVVGVTDLPAWREDVADPDCPITGAPQARA